MWSNRVHYLKANSFPQEETDIGQYFCKLIFYFSHRNYSVRKKIIGVSIFNYHIKSYKFVHIQLSPIHM